MIDIGREELITFAEAAKLLPRRRKGRKTHVSTLHRWCTKGVHDVRLEYLNVGSTRCTSVAALQRFFDALTERNAGGDFDADVPRIQTVSRRKSIRAAQQRLGIEA